jgi:hypothetical protein
MLPRPWAADERRVAGGVRAGTVRYRAGITRRFSPIGASSKRRSSALHPFAERVRERASDNTLEEVGRSVLNVPVLPDAARPTLCPETRVATRRRAIPEPSAQRRLSRPESSVEAIGNPITWPPVGSRRWPPSGRSCWPPTLDRPHRYATIEHSVTAVVLAGPCQHGRRSSFWSARATCGPMRAKRLRA